MSDFWPGRKPLAPVPLGAALFPGMHVLKVRSDRTAQVAGLNATHVWLTWLDTGQQTVVRRERFGRTTEWKAATQ